jgi:hypothetical protein
MSKLIDRNKRDMQMIEGGGAGASGGGGGGSRGLSLFAQAQRNAAKNKTNPNDELLRLEDQMAIKKELAAVKSRPERQKAEKEAATTTKDGVKKTVYPYAGKNEYAKGGKVRGAGVAKKGVKKCKII